MPREVRSPRPPDERTPAGRGRVHRGPGGERGQPPDRPPRSVRALLGLAVVGVLVAGVWGASGLLGLHEPHPAGTGEAIAVPGGMFRVDAVTDRMPSHQMEGMDPDPVPAGHQRFTVDATMAAGSRSVDLVANDFELTAPDGTRYVPVRAQLGGGALPAGTSISLLLVYDVPEGTTPVELRFQDSHPIVLSPPEASSTDAGHGHDGDPREGPEDGSTGGEPSDDTVGPPAGTAEDEPHGHDDDHAH
jgi:hypothetical protein